MTRDEALFEFLLRLGDSTLILGHRVSEWCGHGPYLEEDIALANTALDLIGQTELWLSLAGEIEGKGRSSDDLAYLRDANGFRNFLLVERPNGDFGQTLMRQFLYDAWSVPMLTALQSSTDQRIADIAAKALKESTYHLERSTDLALRLADGTEESHRRMQTALDDLWPWAGEMFIADEADRILSDAGIAPDPSTLRATWDECVLQLQTVGGLMLPENNFAHQGSRKGHHSEHLDYILQEMQWLQRAYPGATW